MSQEEMNTYSDTDSDISDDLGSLKIVGRKSFGQFEKINFFTKCGFNTPMLLEKYLDNRLKIYRNENDNYRMEEECSNEVTDLFTFQRKPTMNLLDFNSRICKYIQIDETIVISSIYYLEKLISLHQIDFSNQNFSKHKIIAVCLMLASKYWDDDSENDLFFSQVYGVSLEDLVKMQYAVLELLEYNLNISQEIFVETAKFIQDTIGQKNEIFKRGFESDGEDETD